MNEFDLRAKEVFSAALDVAPDRRSEFLAGACDGDARLQAEVEALLEAHGLTDTFLETPALDSFRASPRDDASWIGERVGQFRIRSVLASGGMGVVYLAEQEQPSRTVALKMLRSPFPSAESMRRFEYEAEVLARLQHPDIAQIYDAGVHRIGTPDGAGVPYFALEFVEGSEDIVQSAQRQSLGVRRRLQLFVRVCRAVHYAHQRGVIHRDLKPANILVERSQGGPKIIDFGIARAVEPSQTMSQTAAGQIMGTLQYASPEQATGDAAAVDVRTDVYALGAILYELLADQPPFDLQDVNITRAIKMISETEPTRLGALKPELRGDVATIVHKAISRDRDRRYQSAAALGDDIERSLRNEPIAARPPSAGYQLRKFSQRNKALVGGVLASVLILVVGTVAVSFALAEESKQRKAAENAQLTAEVREKQAAEARAAEELERRRAEEFAAASNAQAEFLGRLMRASNPWLIKPEDGVPDAASMARTIDMAAAEFEASEPAPPLTEGAIRLALGQTYHGIGRLDDAERHARRSVECFAETVGDAHEYSIRAFVLLSVIEDGRGRFSSSQAHLERARAAAEMIDDVEPKTQVALRNGLCRSAIRLGRFEEAEALAREAIALAESTGVPSSARIAASQSLADALSQLRRYGEAEPLYRANLEKRRTQDGLDHPATLVVEHNLAGLLIRTGRAAEARPMLEHVLAARRVILGADHSMTLMAMNDLAHALLSLNQRDAARELAEESLEAHISALGPTSNLTNVARTTLARIHMMLGQPVPSAALLEAALEVAIANDGADDPQALLLMNNLGVVYRQMKAYDEAAAILETSWAGYITRYGLNHGQTRAVCYQLAEARLMLADVVGARALIDDLLADEAASQDFVWVPGMLRGADATCLSMEGHADRAQERFREAVAVLSARVGAKDYRTARVVRDALRAAERDERPDDVAHWSALLD